MSAAESLTARLRRCYTGAVYDVMRELGLGEAVLPSTIAPLAPGMTLAGPAWTFSGDLEMGRDPHQTLLGWTEALALAPAGHVAVYQPNTSEIALMGELSAETLQRRGVLGYIVDGGCRDSRFIIERGFPVFCRFRTPRDIVGRWLARGLGEPITIGTVRIATGDYVLADGDGVIVIPGAHAVAVIERTEAAMATENKVRSAILAGTDPREAYRRHGKF